MSIYDYQSARGVYQKDDTRLPKYVPKVSVPVLTTKDKTAITLLARMLHGKRVLEGGARAKRICQNMQANRELPLVGLERHLLMKFAIIAAKDINRKSTGEAQ